MNLGGTVHINRTGYCVILEKEKVINQINLRRLLAIALKSAEDGGKAIVGIKNLVIENKGKTKEGANDSVTTADFKSHCAMTSRLKHNFPTLNVISEESNVICDQTEYSNINDSIVMDPMLNDEWIEEKDVTVWIDPLDATQEYTEKLYKYVTTMVCVAVNGQPVMGIIHNPYSKDTTWAWAGKAKSSNLEKPPDLSKEPLKVIVSRSHTGKAKELVEKNFKNKFEIITAGGAGYKCLEIANGNADVYIHVTAIKKWDVCAGNAILNSIGGQLTTIKNTHINYADSENVVNEDGILAFINNFNLNLEFS